MDGITTSKASDAFPPWAVGLVRGSMIYERKMHQWRADEMRLKAALGAANNAPTPSFILSVRRILELGQNAYSLYLSGTHAERGQLLKTVLSNCVTGGVNHCPTYRKPIDISTSSSKGLKMKNGGDDGTRTRGLCRDRAAF
jgi:hypothetical protein